MTFFRRYKFSGQGAKRGATISHVKGYQAQVAIGGERLEMLEPHLKWDNTGLNLDQFYFFFLATELKRGPASHTERVIKPWLLPGAVIGFCDSCSTARIGIPFAVKKSRQQTEKRTLPSVFSKEDSQTEVSLTGAKPPFFG